MNGRQKGTSSITSLNRKTERQNRMLHKELKVKKAHNFSNFNPIPHGGWGGGDSALLQIVFFITSVRDAAEPRYLVTFPKI